MQMGLSWKFTAGPMICGKDVLLFTVFTSG